MRKKQIDAFFKRLDAELGLQADVIVVGASAGTLMGHIRPSFDIDFEIRPRGRAAHDRASALNRIIEDTARKLGIAVNYSEDVGHWSMINYLDYRKTALPYKKFGKLNVRIIAPPYWTIGKMTRFIETDIQDMVKMIRLKKLSWRTLVGLWAAAASRSFMSLELGQFGRHVEIFVSKYGKRCWGKSFDPEAALRLYRQRSRRG